VWSHIAAEMLPVMLVVAGVVILVWRMLSASRGGHTSTAGGQPGMLLGLLILAAFAMGAFLTYALLGVR
jgi:hypothetical protein